MNAVAADMQVGMRGVAAVDHVFPRRLCQQILDQRSGEHEPAMRVDVTSLRGRNLDHLRRGLPDPDRAQKVQRGAVDGQHVGLRQRVEAPPFDPRPDRLAVWLWGSLTQRKPRCAAARTTAAFGVHGGLHVFLHGACHGSLAIN